MPRRTAWLGGLLLAAAATAAPQTEPAPPAPPPPAAAPATAPPQQPAGQAPLAPRTGEALQRLAERLAERRAARAAAADPAAQAALDAELRDLGWQFAGLAAGLDVQQFEAPAAPRFDLQAELEQLLRPLLQTLKDATSEPRQLADLQARLDLLEQRRRTAEQAAAAAARTRDLLPAGSAARVEAERELQLRWRPLLESIRGELLLLDARLQARRETQQPLWRRLGHSAAQFARQSGANLLLAGLCFAAVFFGVRWLLERLWPDRPPRHFARRLGDVLGAALAIALAAFAALLVPYARDDWLLLALGIVFLLGAGWLIARMLPQFFAQARLLLNMGSVREGERLEVDGLPYRVAALRFYSRLENPALQGGVLRLPLPELMGRHSRPSGDGEPWFPCAPGDTVVLDDGTTGQVLQQTPQSVVVQVPGGQQHYPTAQFLRQNPRNLSAGFAVTAPLRLGHRHRLQAPQALPQQLAAAVRPALQAELPPGQLLGLDVQFQATAPDALELLAIADCAGAAAPRCLWLQRALARHLLAAANALGLDLAVPQLQLRRGEEPA